jgi:iron complex outermembrane receptor protein
MNTTSPLAASPANSSFDIANSRARRAVVAALLLSSAATPALAQTTPAPVQAPTPSSTNSGQVEQTTQQSPSNAAAAPQASDVANPQTGSTAIENSPQGPQEQQATRGTLGDIVVTATKRETNLQRTPIALTVANTQALVDRHAQSLLDLGDGSIPSLRVATFEARQSALTVGIRGIVPFDQNQTARDTPIGVYVDGVYLGRSQGLNASLLDIDRIEVLRGPQGTLFGRNTEGGALSIITKAPSGVFGVRGVAGYGNYGSYEGALHVDLPAFYNFAIKLDGIVQHQDATVRNPLAGQYGWNYNNTVGGRAAGRWTPVDGLSVDLVYDYTKNQNTPNYSQLINYNPNGFNVGTYTNPTTGAVGTSLFFNGAACNVTVGGVTTNPCIRPLSPIVVVSGRNRQGVAEIGVPQQPSVDRTHGFSGTIKYKALDNLELRSITAWRGVSTNQWDNSGGAHRTTFAPNTPFSRYSLSELFQNQFSQEFQAVGSFTNVDYVVGAYYFNEHAEEAAATPSTNRWNVDGTSYTILSENGNGVPQPPYNCSNPSVPTPPVTPTQPPQGWDRQYWCVQRHSTAVSKSYAGFGQATWTPLPPLHITLGARYTHDKRDGVLDVVNGNVNAGGAAVLPVPFTFHFSKGRVDPLAILAFDASNSVHLYAKYSTGYRAGGANDRSATFQAFGPETVKAFEIGAKTDFWEHRARLNVAAYYMKRTDTQTDFDNVDTNPTSPTFNLHTEETVNAPGVSKIKGIEADLTVRPIDILTLGASYAYTNVKIPPAPNPFIAGHPLFQVYPVYTPKNAASGFADFEVPAGFAGGKWRLHLDANYAGKQYSFQNEKTKTDSSFIVNGRFALADVEMNQGSTLMTFALWSRNLLDETHIYRRSAANSSPAPNFSNVAGVPTPNGTFNYGGILGDYGNFNPPRTFGAEISFKVGAPRMPMAYEAPPAPPPPPPATVTCESGAVVTAPGVCPPPPPPPAPAPERGQ